MVFIRNGPRPRSITRSKDFVVLAIWLLEQLFSLALRILEGQRVAEPLILGSNFSLTDLDPQTKPHIRPATTIYPDAHCSSSIVRD